MSTASVISPRGAARLFLMARGRGGENATEDEDALTKLISEYALKAYNTALLDMQRNLNKLLQEQIDAVTRCGHRDDGVGPATA